MTRTTLLFLNIKTKKHKPKAPRVTGTGEREACGAATLCPPKNGKLYPEQNNTTELLSLGVATINCTLERMKER